MEVCVLRGEAVASVGRWKSRFLHCAAHDEAVSNSGRNDGFLVWRESKEKGPAFFYRAFSLR